MPFAFLVVGAVLVVAGVRGTDDDLLTLLKGDFTGSPNFLSWLLAILLVGAFGYIEPLKPVSRAFLFLILVVLFFKSDTGFFPQLTKFLKGVGQGSPAPQGVTP